MGTLTAIKIRKTDLRKSPAEFIAHIGAKSADKKLLYPMFVYMSNSDLKLLRKNMMKQCKKDFPYLTNFKREAIVGADWLNYSPSGLAQFAIKPGWVLVDFEAMQKQADHDAAVLQEERRQEEEARREVANAHEVAKEPYKYNVVEVEVPKQSTTWEKFLNLFK